MVLRGELSLPADFQVMSDSSPTEAWAWLLQAGVSVGLCRTYGIGWSDVLARVVMPVWSVEHGEGKQLIAVQSRAVFPKQTPKYLNKTGGQYKAVLFRSDDSTLLDEPLFGDTLVLTEDILSTIRTGRIIPSASSLGTSLSEPAAAAIISSFPRVFIWYDGDSAGLRGANKARKVLELQGAEVHRIETDKDPKEYNNDEIRRILTETHTKRP